MSDARFADGLAYRIEIPSVEGPEALQAVLDEAAARDVPVRRVSQGSGVMMLTDEEIGAMAAGPREAAALRVPRRAPCLRIVRVYFDDTGEIVEMSASVHPAERFTYAMELEAGSA